MTPRLPLPPGAYRRLPNYGVCRVARDVYESPALPSSEGPVHRFDDPEQRYSVRYTAQDIETCLLETMQRFRPALTTELDRRLDTVTGADQADHTPDAAAGLIDWLARQRVGRLLTHESDITVIDLPTGFFASTTRTPTTQTCRTSSPATTTVGRSPRRSLPPFTHSTRSPAGSRTPHAVPRTRPAGPCSSTCPCGRSPTIRSARTTPNMSPLCAASAPATGSRHRPTGSPTLLPAWFRPSSGRTTEQRLARRTVRRSRECTVAQVSRAWPPAPPPDWPERVSQGCPKEIRKRRHSFKFDTRAREVLLLAKERALHLDDPRLAYEMCHYLAEQPNKRNHAAVERIVTTVRGKATTDPRFIGLEAWHTFTFRPAVKRAEAKKAAVLTSTLFDEVGVISSDDAYRQRP